MGTKDSDVATLVKCPCCSHPDCDACLDPKLMYDPQHPCPCCNHPNCDLDHERVTDDGCNHVYVCLRCGTSEVLQ